MGHKFRPPPLSSDRAWKVVLFLVRHGFYFDSIPIIDDHGSRTGTVPYPTTMEDARDFVQRYESFATPVDALRNRNFRIGR